MSFLQFIKQFFIKNKPIVGSSWRITYPCSLLCDGGYSFVLKTGTIITVLSTTDTAYLNCAYVIVEDNKLCGEIKLELWDDKDYPMIRISK